jgi:hypothetical protein
MTNPHLPAYTNRSIKDFLIANGAAGTIYAFVFPETRKILNEVLDGGDRDDIVHTALAHVFAQSSVLTLDDASEAVTKALDENRAKYTDMFEAAWTGRQDEVHTRFFDAWKKWSAPVVTLKPELSNFTYPTAGAGEGLREAKRSIIIPFAAA